MPKAKKTAKKSSKKSPKKTKRILNIIPSTGTEQDWGMENAVCAGMVARGVAGLRARNQDLPLPVNCDARSRGPKDLMTMSD